MYEGIIMGRFRPVRISIRISIHIRSFKSRWDTTHENVNGQNFVIHSQILNILKIYKSSNE